MNAHAVTQQFEQALCDYTGAPYAVAVNSCTAALTLAVAWCIQAESRKQWAGAQDYLARQAAIRVVSIPKRTYVSVPMAVIHAGGRPVFRDEEWMGMYQLQPLLVWDSARAFTSGMYGDHDIEHGPGTMLCLSFHASKILGDTQGGAILHDNPEADAWLRRARFDGRSTDLAPKDDKDIIVGWHFYISPDVCARLLMRLTAANFPRHHDPLPNDQYVDCSSLECFK